MAFDPNQPFTIVEEEEVGFDPTKPFSVVEPSGTSFGKEVSQLGSAFVESIGRPLENMGESFESFGFTGVADALKGAITEPENYVSAGQRFIEPAPDEAQFMGFAWQYAPRAAVEQVGQAIGAIGTRAVGAAAGGAVAGPPGAIAGGFVGPAIFGAAQVIGPVAKERAMNNGREVPNNEDLVAATLTAIGSGSLDAIGARYLPGGDKATGKFFKRVASSFVGEGVLTETPQSFIEQIGSTAGTEKGLNINVKQAVGEGLISGTSAAGLTAIVSPFSKPVENQVIRTPEQAEELDIDAKANQEAILLMGDPADQTQNERITKLKEIESVIANNETLMSGLEPNAPERSKLDLENRAAIKEAERLKSEIKQSVGLSEPITEAERQQAELAKAIVEEPAPMEPLPVPPAQAAPVAAPVEQVVTPPVEAAPTTAEAAPVEPVVSQEFKDELEMSGVAYDGDTRYSVQQSSNGTFRAERIVNGKKEDIQIGLPDIETAQNVIFNSVGKEVPAITAETPAITTPEIQQQVPSGMSVEEAKAYLEERNKSTILGYAPEDIMAMQQGKRVARTIPPAPVTEQAAPAEAPAPEVAPAEQAEMPKDFEITGKKITKISTENGIESATKDYASALNKKGIKTEISYDVTTTIGFDTVTKTKKRITSNDNVSSGNIITPQGKLVILSDGSVNVFKPTALTPAVSETITEPAAAPTGIAVGNRVQLGKSPQTYTIEEEIPQSANDKKLGEQYYNVKNERTGKTQVVEKNDMKPVSSRRRKMASEPDPLPENERYGQVKLNQRIQRYFGGKIPDRVYVVDDAVDKEKKYQAAYYPDLGILIVNNAYIKKNANVGDIIAHELGHYAFGDKKFKAAFDNFYNSLSPEDKAKIDKIVEESYNEETEESQIEESKVIAFTSYTIVNPQRRSLWNAVLDALKEFANKVFGKNFQMSDPNRTALAILSTAKKRFAAGEEIVREDTKAKRAAEQAQDARFAELEARAKAGDKEAEAEAQRMVDEAAKEAGYAIDSYHGTNGDLFTIFSTEAGGDKTFAESARLGIFSTDNPDVAQTYAENIGVGGTFALGLGQGPLVEARDRAIATPEFKALSQAKDAAEKEYSATSKRIYDKYLEVEKSQLQSARDAFRSMLQGKTEAEIDQFIEEVAARGASRAYVADEAVNKNPEITAAQDKINEASKAINEYIYPFLLEALPNVRVMQLKLQIKNPKVYDAKGQTPADFSLSDKIQEAKDLGHDGVIFENIIDPKLPATHYVVFNPEQIKSADPFTYDDAGNLIPLSERFQPSSPDIRRMAARKGQVASIKNAGAEKKTPKQIIARTKELLRQNFFNPSEVTEQNTLTAFRDLGKLVGNKKEAAAYAEELNDIGRLVDEQGVASEVSMGAILFTNDLFEYSIKLAAEGQKMMLGIMMSNMNKLPLGEGITLEESARAMRGALERSTTFTTMGKAEQDAYINYVAEFMYGPNPTKEQIQSIKDAYAAVDKTAPVTEQELTDEIAAVGGRTGTDLVGKINDEFTKATEKGKEKRKTEEQELDKEYKKIQKQADAEIEKLAKIQSDTPSFDPAVRQIINEVRAIVANDLKQRPDMESKADWKSALIAKLQQVGVEPAAAGILADIVWRQHEINSLSRELSSINKAIEKGPISEIVKAIKDTPLEDQQKPNWRYEVMRDYLRKAGLPLAQAERIAKLMDISLQKRFTMAQEQAFTDAISKSAPWKTGDTRSRRAFQKVLQALRAGALDPARNVLSDMAALNGWTGFTPEQYKALLKNDAILSDPKAGELKKAEAYKAIQDVISKAKLPIRARNVIGQYYDAQALSGIPTLTVNAFSPIAFAMRNAIIEIGSGTLKGNPKAITNAATALVDSIKSWANTVAFSFKNNVTVYSNVDYIVNDDNLLRLYRRGVDQFKGGKTARDKADGVKNMMIGMMDYVRRILNALDYGAIASLQNQNISKYSMAVMKRQGMSTKEGNEMFAVMMKAKNDFYLQQIAIGTDKNKASILADEYYVSSWGDALTKAGVEKSDIKQAMDAAINDALSAVGRNRQSLDSLKDEATKLKDAGVSSMPALWLLESMANAANQSDNQILKLFSRVIYGFAIVPARVIRETAWFSPYGFVRFGYDAIAKKMGKTSPYAQSLGTDVQYSQRLNEAIAGTVALIALASLRGSSTDEPEEDEFKIVFTGNGPKRIDDPQFYDSWYKAGNKPNSMIVSFGKTKIPFNMMRGFEAFTWPAMMLGAVDDLEIRKKQKRDTNTNTQIQDASIVAGFVFDAALRRGPYAFTTKSLFGTYGDIGVEGVAKGLTFPAKTLIPVLGTSLASNLSNFINDPIDRRTLDGAVWSNIPFIGPAVAPKSLNAFGEPALSTDFASKMFKLGVPLVYDIPTDRESIKLHELVLKQGGGPSIPTRNQLAQRLDREPTNKEYEMFVKEYGAKISSDMKRRYEELSNKTPEKYSKSVEKIGNRARDIAERKVREAAKKP